MRMVKGFHELKALNPELYGTISTVVVQIKRNAFAGILLQCDPGETLEKEAVTTKDFSHWTCTIINCSQILYVSTLLGSFLYLVELGDASMWLRSAAGAVWNRTMAFPKSEKGALSRSRGIGGMVGPD